ncbi:MAG TPA: dihydrofolate reductase family protein [bacterium]|nr:dihydrofolate reductase family protein [bacterium]
MTKRNRPLTTLFMLMSVDGKISTGKSDVLDFDKDFPKIEGLKEGLQQYYDIEQTTDLFSLNSGKVQAKIGANEKRESIRKLPVSFLIIDNKPHLNDVGVDNFIRKSKKLFIITTNKNHPAFARKEENLEIIYYENEINFEELFVRLKQSYNINNITVQTGGNLNAVFLRKKLIDRLSVVVAPALIGGIETPSLIDGISLLSPDELKYIKALKLVDVKKLDNSYIHLLYDVVNDTAIKNMTMR